MKVGEFILTKNNLAFEVHYENKQHPVTNQQGAYVTIKEKSHGDIVIQGFWSELGPQIASTLQKLLNRWVGQMT